MNTHRGKAKFINLQIIFESGFSTTIIVGKMNSKIERKRDANIMYVLDRLKLNTRSW